MELIGFDKRKRVAVYKCHGRAVAVVLEEGEATDSQRVLGILEKCEEKEVPSIERMKGLV